MLVGAEGVVENGGVINKLGTYNIAIAAKAHNIPFYVASESYKVSIVALAVLATVYLDSTAQLKSRLCTPGNAATQMDSLMPICCAAVSISNPMATSELRIGGAPAVCTALSPQPE